MTNCSQMTNGSCNRAFVIHCVSFIHVERRFILYLLLFTNYARIVGEFPCEKWATKSLNNERDKLVWKSLLFLRNNSVLLFNIIPLSMDGIFSAGCKIFIPAEKKSMSWRLSQFPINFSTSSLSWNCFPRYASNLLDQINGNH